MSKRKNKANSWFKQIFSRKRANRTRKLPMAYIEALATRIHEEQPSKQIIVNSLAGFAEELLAKGYMWRISDHKFFRAKQEKAFNDYWNQERTKIDDFIHSKRS
jgi:hypothetical protein